MISECQSKHSHKVCRVFHDVPSVFVRSFMPHVINMFVFILPSHSFLYLILFFSPTSTLLISTSTPPKFQREFMSPLMYPSSAGLIQKAFCISHYFFLFVTKVVLLLHVITPCQKLYVMPFVLLLSFTSYSFLLDSHQRRSRPSYPVLLSFSVI